MRSGYIGTQMSYSGEFYRVSSRLGPSWLDSRTKEGDKQGGHKE